MKAFPIPVVALGPGSQPVGDMELDFVSMPALEPRRHARVPDAGDPRALHRAAALLARFEERWRRWRVQSPYGPRSDVSRLPAPVLAMLDECLGQGEVSAMVRRPDPGAPPRLRVQETSFTGLWRVQALDEAGGCIAQSLEVGIMPAAVCKAANTGLRRMPLAGPAPAGAMNAPALLNELDLRLRERRRGDPAHVMNLSLLPLSPEDRACLDSALGGGTVSILSRGFGNCRIDATALRGVWRVRHFNSMETPILDTIEIVDMPEAALAAPVDIDDSLARLPELLEWMSEA